MPWHQAPKKDVTSCAGNIVQLTFERKNGSSPLVGIGDYAFYGCTNIDNISLGNGLNTLGNYAFADCRNLNTVQMDYNTNLNTLGAYAFANCEKLQEFALPTNVRIIGDFCFMNCSELKKMDMTGEAYQAVAPNGLSFSLDTIGYKAFMNCTSLTELVLPKSYNGKEKGTNEPVFHLSTVQGCKALKRIKTPSQTLRFVTDAEASTDITVDGVTYYTGGYGDGSSSPVDGSYTFDIFKTDVGEEFYFEGPGFKDGTGNTVKTPIHNVANVRYICFRYYDEDRYEIVEEGIGVDGSGTDIAIGLVFEIDSPGNLIGFHVEEPTTGKTLGVKVPEITMPEKIGPFYITSIVEGSFNDNCWIQKVTIPASVVNIGSNAFKGSHSLKHVLFSDAANIRSIGRGAFATQVVGSLHGVSGSNNNCGSNDFLNDKTPFLSFTGKIEKDDGTNTEPFQYAMRETSNINEGQQRLSYITYYSGMPTNLTVKYNPETKMSELQYFPTKTDLINGFQVADTHEGAYTPHGVTGKYYRFPYMNTNIETEAAGAFNDGGTENQTNMKNGVENIVIPNGVNSIKEGLFSGLNTDGYILGSDKQLPDPADVTGYAAPAPDVKTLTVKSVAEIKPYTFSRMPELTTAYVSGAATIGNYAFDQCKKLESAEIGPATTALGLRPFSGCENLINVTFPDSASFDADNGIIYGIEAGSDGTKTKKRIVECLEARGKIPDGVGSRVAGPDEFAGITEIAPEAFMDCDNVIEVDLSTSSVKEVPVRAFAEMDRLSRVILPGTAAAIRDGAFWNTTRLGSVTIPNNVAIIAPNAFARVEKNDDGTYKEPEKDRGDMDPVVLIANKDSTADFYADDYDYIVVSQDDSLRTMHNVWLYDDLAAKDAPPYKTYEVKHGDSIELTVLDIVDHTAEGYQFSRWWPSADIYNPIVADTEIRAMYDPIGAKTYTVRFFDINREEMKAYTQQVVEGSAARAPSRDEMAVDGKVFTGWDRDITRITSDLDVYAQYTDRVAGKYYVTFWTDMDMTTMIGKVQEVGEGESAIEPAHPTKEGYTFSRWSSDAWQNVTKDLDIFAVYVEGGSNNPNKPNDPNKPNNPNNGNNGNNNGGNSNNNNDDDKKDDSVSGNGTKYKVVVNGGSGSGEYTAGTIVPINAYAKSDGTVFDKWTSSSNGVGFVNQTAISTTFTMPSNNVEITANFKVGSSSSVSGNSRSARRNSTTTVDVTKGGISNTGIASANVNGSSDNYVVRITEDAQATAAVIAALEARYGDLSNIAYLPMDISLYDSTGTTKITDVSGISVDITLPLPDDLIQYAGNNKAASVVNGRLEDLNAKFTTIDGVPCIQFTATHFSPYTIYVDKGHLSEGTIDATPKTGDPIHPKWFLAMGLACISIVLFCKKDKQLKVKHA